MVRHTALVADSDTILMSILAEIETFAAMPDAAFDEPDPYVFAMYADGVPYEPAFWNGGPLSVVRRMAFSRAARRLGSAAWSGGSRRRDGTGSGAWCRPRRGWPAPWPWWVTAPTGKPSARACDEPSGAPNWPTPSDWLRPDPLTHLPTDPFDLVVTYKVDRLSRSLLDFARLMETFDRHHVAFVSVTQRFDTATSMGRLVLNVLLSFAQFEREIISERTRDKIATTRRKGKWSGGRPPLGYDVDPNGQSIAVNPTEAARVRAIFELFLEHGSLMPTVAELRRRKWFGKRWTKRDGQEAGGAVFDRTGLYRLLTNVVYVGKLRYKDEVHTGRHSAIVSEETWQRVQDVLHGNGRAGGAFVRTKSGALLAGILRCTPCDSAMSPSFSTRRSRQYRYYVCSKAQKNGWCTCPSKSIPAGEIEAFVVDQVRRVGRDAELRNAVIAEADREQRRQREDLDAAGTAVRNDLATAHSRLRELAASGNIAVIDQLADEQQRIARLESRRHEIERDRNELDATAIDPAAAAEALAAFDPVCESLTPHERARAIGLLVETIGYDGSSQRVVVRFRPTGLRSLTEEFLTPEPA